MKKHALFVLMFVNFVYSQQDLPKLTLKNLKHENVELSKYNKKDKLYVFAFWATWCAPCVQELNAISDVYDDWKEKIDVEIIAISVDDSRTVQRVKPLVNGKGWDYEILLDVNQDLKRSLSIANVPYLIVVKNGKILFTHNGHSPGGENQLYETLINL